MATVITELFSFTEITDGIYFDGKATANAFNLPPTPTAYGSVSGYTHGGQPNSNVIDKFPFASDANATDVGNLTRTSTFGSQTGASSLVSGYSVGGGPAPTSNVIDKYPFAADGNATDVGDLTQARGNGSGHESDVSGYTAGGQSAPIVNTIDKFAFATDANATDVGDLPAIRAWCTDQSSLENGYVSGGNTGSSTQNTIYKFSFATDGNATDVANLSQARNGVVGQSSLISGYTSGGHTTGLYYPANSNVIDKFPFASDANATDVGNLTSAVTTAAGQSSTASGYRSGGITPPYVATNTIDKFPFASDANATDVGDLTTASRHQVHGNQSSV